MRSSIGRSVPLFLAAMLCAARPAHAQDTDTLEAPTGDRVTCSSQDGTRQHCPADTSQGVAIRVSSGSAPCLLGKSWGYDDTGIWVSDGCAGEFIAGPSGEPQTATPLPPYKPNVGFLLFSGEKGEMYLRLFTYVRYLNQRMLADGYVDSFGNFRELDLRQDVQMTKVFFPFSGWFMTPKLRYYLYTWTSNASQGEGAQVAVAGNISYNVRPWAILGFGITSLPSTRSTEGQFPFWLGVDDRLTADEWFRGSYTQGFWVKGELPHRVAYMAMMANNLSTLGVSAAKLDDAFDTQSFSLTWMPSTGEFGLFGTFGDYDYHEMIATRFGAHFTHSREDKQSQPGTDDIENTQIRLGDGNVIFTPDLFGPGIGVDVVHYHMASVDAAIKYRGMSLEGEVYRRWLSGFHGLNTAGLDEIVDHGFQLQSSAMVVPSVLQMYLSGSHIWGDYGDPGEVRAGANWYVQKERGFRVNAEWILLDESPVGYTAVPYPVGGDGNLFSITVEMNF